MKQIIPSLLLALVILSCSDAPVDSGTSWYNTNDAGVFAVGRQVRLYRDSTVVTEIATASFRGPDSVGLAAGVVELNSVRMIPATVSPRTYGDPNMIWSGILYQIYSATDTVPLEFGGAPHVFRTTGSGKFPAMADSINSPSEELQLLYPGVLDTVDRSEGLTVRWKPISDPDAKIQVRFFSFSDGDNPEVVTGASVGELPDNGSYTISAETLATYPAGTLVVTVLRYVEKNGRSGTQRYSMKVYSEVMSLSRMIP